MNNKKIDKVIDYLYQALQQAEDTNKYKTYATLREFIDLLDSITDDSYMEFIEEYLQ